MVTAENMHEKEYTWLNNEANMPWIEENRTDSYVQCTLHTFPAIIKQFQDFHDQLH